MKLKYIFFQYPRLFSLGVVSHEGPSEKTMQNTHFTLTFHAIGWSEKQTEPTDQYTQKPNKKMIAKVRS